MQSAPHDVRPLWRKSTRSGEAGCVEVALSPVVVGVRDSKDPAGPTVSFAPEAWRSFIDLVRAGGYDLPSD